MLEKIIIMQMFKKFERVDERRNGHADFVSSYNTSIWDR